MTLCVGIVIGIVMTVAILAMIPNPSGTTDDAEIDVQVHAFRRRLELEAFKREARNDANRVRRELTALLEDDDDA